MIWYGIILCIIKYLFIFSLAERRTKCLYLSVAKCRTKKNHSRETLKKKYEKE